MGSDSITWRQLYYKLECLSVEGPPPACQQKVKHLQFDLEITFPLVWPWPHLWPWPQTSQTKLNWCPGSKFNIFMRWPWPWPNDLGTQTWPGYGQDVTPYQKWSFYVNSFKSYSPNGQTDSKIHRHDENITSTAYAGGNYSSHLHDHLSFVTGNFCIKLGKCLRHSQSLQR